MEGCLGILATRTAMRVHFVHRHVHDTVVMLEEGNLPLPRFPRCDLQVSRKAINGRHLGTIQCRTRKERKRRQLGEAEMWENLEHPLQVFPHIRLRQPSLLPFRPRPALAGPQVAPVELLPGDLEVALGDIVSQ